ncbi:MAB_1171c family putative transporter [Streptomyces sp. NPDC046197]|uniref:MAB_1171c family putative transporter n=1 Tax=Streptomyces sp. NPDC046197 TaxID=3154337 RepID=UPI0033DD4C15
MSLVVYLAAIGLATASVLLFRRPRTALRDPLTASTCVAIALGALVFVCSAPLTLGAVNRLTGIPNFGAPLTYGTMSAYSCSLLILLVHWRGGSRHQRRKMVRRCVAAYSLLIIAIVVLFAKSDAPTERLSDLDTYYANTAYMRETILLYLIGHGAAILTMCSVCVKWGREVGGLLRTGLRLILIGALVDFVGFLLTKYTAVMARWTDHDLDFLSTTVAPPMASLAALICSVGFVLPRLVPATAAQWHSMGALRELRPLWRKVQFASTAPKPSPSWWHLPQQRLHWLEVSIHDALLDLAHHFDETVRQTAFEAALNAGRTPHQARVVSEAVMLADAACRAAAHEEPLEAPSTYRLNAAEVSGTSGLLELSHALTCSPATDAFREGTVKTSLG